MPMCCFAYNFENKSDEEVLGFCRRGTRIYFVSFVLVTYQLIKYFIHDEDYLSEDDVEINSTILSINVLILLAHNIMFVTTFWKKTITQEDMTSALYSLLVGLTTTISFIHFFSHNLLN